MKNIDYSYLGSLLGNLSGVPIRVFRGENQIFYCSIVKLPKDPLGPYLKSVLSTKKHIDYYITPAFDYYGIVSSGPIKIIIGPTRQSPLSDQEIREQAFELDVEAEDLEEFKLGIKSIVPMPFVSVLQILCAINYVLNHEKLTLEDVTIAESAQKVMQSDLETQKANKSIDGDPFSEEHELHNTIFIERTIANIVRKGDTAALRQWASSAPAVRAGVLAKDQLRQIKNTFIVTATIVSRAAIRGGMDVDEALSLSDSYIQKCEFFTSVESIMNLQFRMVSDYTEKVERLRNSGCASKFTIEVSNYVQKHISEPIDIKALSKAMYLSRSRFSTKFKEQTGMSPIDFITREKIEEAKRLIKYTDKPLSSIGDYLGFSSQSHFSRTFKKHTGLSPNEYRLKYAE